MSGPITLVTGNPNKLAELREIFPADIELVTRELDIEEIQAEPREIVRDKLERAYAEVGGPVIVEDVSAELDALNGFPGPFIKFAEQSMGRDALWTMVQGQTNRRASMRCTMGYFDGSEPIIVDGVVHGTIVKPREGEGWGFDFCFMMDGERRTNSQLDPGEKNRKSHRYLAVKALTEALFS